MGSIVHITCLCGKSAGTVRLSAESLPAETVLCHCNSCRHTSGLLCVSYLKLATPPGLGAPLVSHQSSATMQRQFCGTCGSHMLAYSFDRQEWYLATGVIETPNAQSIGNLMQTTRLTQHEFTSDTLDGGLAPCLTTFSGRKLPFFAQGPDEEPLTENANGHPELLPAVSHSSSEQPRDFSSADDLLHASCHCGGVQFMLSRPNEQSSQLSSPWPDLLVPYHSGSSKNDQDVKWWLRGGNKYLAGTCTCRSCRLASGFPIQTWAFVPKANIMIADGQPLSFRTGTLRQYTSTTGIYREFCSKCGASVFWHCDERPDLLDVSVGLLRAAEGSRAETWLEWWTGRVSFEEDAIDTELVDALQRGLLNISHTRSEPRR